MEKTPRLAKANTYQRGGCSVTRLTLEDDATSTGGSPWQNINSKTLGGPERIKEHRRLFNKIRASFKTVAKECHKHGGRIAIEWPKACVYWRTKHVKQYIQDFNLDEVHINRCALGSICR